jgi:hypothetical protein
MGITPNPGFQAAYGHVAQSRQYAEEQRVAGRNAQAQQFENALQNPANDPNDPKLQASTDDTPDIANQKQAEVAKRTALRGQLFQQHAALFQPHESPTLFSRLGGLISGKVKPAPATAPAQPASSPAPTAPVTGSDSAGPQVPVDPNAPPPAPIVKDALGIPITDPNVAAAHQEPLHPMASSHPILDRFKEGLDALGNHLSAAAHPGPAPVDTSALLASSTTTPETLKRQDLSLQNQAAINLEAERRKRYLLTRTPENKFLDQFAADNGSESFNDLPSDKQSEGLAAFKKANLGPKLTTAIVVDPDSSTGYSKVSMNQLTGEVGSTIPGITPPRGFIPTQRASRSTDQYGNVTTSVATVTPQVPGGNAAPVGGNSAPRPVSKNAPTSSPNTPPLANVQPSGPDLASLNAGIQANKGKAGAPNRKLAATPTQPVSAAAPPPSGQLRQLDTNGQIPEGVANPQVREAGQQLIDDRDVDKIPTKARESAAALARKYGWSQGKFTPREETQVNTAAQFLTQLQQSDSLDVLNSFSSRQKIAEVLDKERGHGVIQNLTAMNLTPMEADFIRRYNAAVGTVQGLASITRTGRPTEAMVGRLKAELPSVLQSSSPDDARQRIGQLLQEIDVAKQKGSLGAMRGATPKQQYKKGDSIKLKDGTTATVDGYDANGKLLVH